jgi:MFS transporter, OFA family, oxalate/formate antiporter
LLDSSTRTDQRRHQAAPIGSLTRLVHGRLFYGWVVVAATFLVLVVDFGVVYSFGAFFDLFARDFRADRSTVALVFALNGPVYFALGAVTGPLADRVGPRRLCLLGAAAFLAGLGLASRATDLWQLYASYSLLVGLAVGATYVPSVATVQRWFIRRRALASGIAVSGIGVGTLLGPLVATGLTAAHGWRATYLLAGLLAAGLAALAGVLLVRAPEVVGLLPDGGTRAEGHATARADAPAGRGTPDAIRSRAFFWLYLAMVFTCIPLFMGAAHLAPFARDAGLDAALVAATLGLFGAGSTLGRLVLAPLTDRLGRRPAYMATIASVLPAMLAWLLLPATWAWPLLAWAALFGAITGTFVALAPAVIADTFGRRAVGGTLGVYYTGAGVGAFLGPWLAGALFDRYGSYVPAIVVGALAAVAATTAVWRVGPGQPSPKRASRCQSNMSK